jgi:hypothetical protein
MVAIAARNGGEGACVCLSAETYVHIQKTELTQGMHICTNTYTFTHAPKLHDFKLNKSGNEGGIRTGL